MLLIVSSFTTPAAIILPTYNETVGVKAPAKEDQRNKSAPGESPQVNPTQVPVQ